MNRDAGEMAVAMMLALGVREVRIRKCDLMNARSETVYRYDEPASGCVLFFLDDPLAPRVDVVAVEDAPEDLQIPSFLKRLAGS